jgi:trigger factor
MAEYKAISGSRVEFQLEISEEAIKKAHKSALDSFRKNVAVKGFRKGHAPDEVVMQSVGLERISYEAMNRAIDVEYRDFLTQNEISPVSQPQVDVKDWEKKPLQVKCIVEVYPEVKLGDFKNIKVPSLEIKVEEKELDEVIATVMSDSQLGKKVDRVAKKGDIVVIDFLGRAKDGSILPRTDGKDQRVRLGMGHFLEDLEKGIMGMKVGEEKKDIKVKFPKDYHSSDIAGKTVPFEVKLHAVEEIDVKSFNEEMIEKVTGQKKTVEQFREDLQNMIVANKTQTEKKKQMEAYQEKLVKMTKCELPESWIEGEVMSRLNRIKTSPQFQHDPEAFWKQMGKTEEDLKKEFRADSAESLKSYLALVEAVKISNVVLTPEEEKEAEHEASHAPEHVSKGQAFEKAVLSRKIDKFLDQAVS